MEIRPLTVCALLLICTIFAFVLIFFENIVLKNQIEGKKIEMEKLRIEKDEIISQRNKQIASFGAELSKKKNEIYSLSEILSETEVELNKTREQLLMRVNQLNITTEELRNMEKRYAELNESMLMLSKNLTEMEKGLNEYLSWFSENSAIPVKMAEQGNVKMFMHDTKSKCIGTYEIDLGCIPISMEKTLNFQYRIDLGDRLYSLKEIVERESGDCEDYSLFIVGYLNYMKNNYPSAELLLNAWKTGGAEKLVIYREENKYYYLPNAKKKEMGDLKKLYPVVMCYTHECKSEDCTGHCIIALSPLKIEKINDLNNLIGAHTFEPQNGEYTGVIGTNYNLCENGMENCEKKTGYISVVIGNSDLYYFTGENWQSYGQYLELVKQLKSEIN